MVRLALVGVLLALLGSPSSLHARALAQFAPRCLHGSMEQSNDQLRREQALNLAQAINRGESSFRPQPPSQPRTYRPLDQLNLPPTPSGFRLQFYIDGPTYTFSLKDTMDPCRYAIFSDQDQGIYQATTAVRTGAHVVPADNP